MDHKNRAQVQAPKSARPAGPRLSCPQSAVPEPVPVETYRVEGFGRRRAIQHLWVVGRSGEWTVTGARGLRVTVKGRTPAEAVRAVRRQIAFRPVVFRKIEAGEQPAK